MTDAELVLAHLRWHPAKRRKLVGRLGSAEAVRRAVASGRLAAQPEDRVIAQAPAEELRERLDKLGVVPVACTDLPANLQAIDDPPDLLFVKGALPAEPGVAVVGSRKASAYGMQLARAFGSALASAGVAVVSGLARGIDGAVHDAAVSGGGTAVAVLGCGIDRWYPAEHRGLGEAILAAGGAVVSEYAPGATPAAWRFPVRNRIVSGLVEAVLVVEATERGGALITARTAADQGRTVLAVPGDVDRPTAAGCNLLIRDGAIPILGASDLLALVATATHIPVRPPEADPLLALIGLGRRPEWLVAETGLPVTELFVRLGRLEAIGRVEWRDGLVCATGG